MAVYDDLVMNNRFLVYINMNKLSFAKVSGIGAEMAKEIYAEMQSVRDSRRNVFSIHATSKKSQANLADEFCDDFKGYQAKSEGSYLNDNDRALSEESAKSRKKTNASTKHLTSMKIKMFALRGNMTRKSKQATRQRKQKELSMRKQNKANQLSKIALWLLMFLPFFMVGVI